MKNLEIAKILYEIADMLEVQGVEFKPRAYRRAARSIEDLNDDIALVMERGDKIPGVGEAIAKKIDEILKTGKLKYFEDLKKEMPFDMESMVAVEGLGAKTAYRLYKELGIVTLDDLEKAARAGWRASARPRRRGYCWGSSRSKGPENECCSGTLWCFPKT